MRCSAAGRVVVLAGAGPAFSAGHDLVEIVDGSSDEHVAVSRAATA